MDAKTIIAIDPGPEESAFIILGSGSKVVEFGKLSNKQMRLRIIDEIGKQWQSLVIEQIACMGMPVGVEVLETVFWSGRFAEAWGGGFHRIKRHEVKMHLCHNMRAKDANIRQALIDRFGGKQCTKRGGVLHGVSGDVWAALAVAVTFQDLRLGSAPDRPLEYHDSKESK